MNSISFPKSLTFKQARAVVAIAFSLGILISAIQITMDYFAAEKQMGQTVTSAMKSVKNPAQSAMFNLDRNIGKDVLQGLFEYPAVLRATLIEDGDEFVNLQRKPVDFPFRKFTRLIFGDSINLTISLDTSSSQNEKKIIGEEFYSGQLVVVVDTYHEGVNFLNRAIFILISGIVRNMLLALSLLVFFHFFITRPVLEIEHALCSVSPKEPSMGRLKPPNGHHFDEFANLVSGANKLLEAIEDNIEKRIQNAEEAAILKAEMIEGQNRESKQLSYRLQLETKVAERTNDLLTANQKLEKEIQGHERAETALKEREEQYRAVVDNIGDYIMRYDKEFKHTFANRNALEISGLPADQYIGKNHYEMGFPEHLCDLWKKNIKLVFTTGKQQNIEFDVELAGGTMSLELQLNPEFAIDGSVQTVIGIARDASLRKQAEADKKKFESRLQQAQKMETIGTLAGGIAHDFNNILSPIVGFSEMLQEDLPENSPELDSINEVLQAALRAKDLVRQILSFGRPVAQEFKPVKLQPILKEALKLLKSTIPKTIDIQNDIDPNCGVVVADPTQLHQVIMNLATNAYHAMQESGGKLKVSLTQTEIESKASAFFDLSPGKYALLKVIDTGTGIDKDVIDKIFDPYFSTKEKDKGTGLGLSVVHGIIKSCKGDIHIYSEPDKGTEINVYLPIMRNASNNTSPDRLPPIQRGTERILLVDDEKAIVKMVQQMLERLGYQVTTKTESIAALEVFKAHPDNFDLIITDMTMPKMTGLQLADKIKAVRADISIIICTGFSDQINEESSTDFGIQAYISKPVMKREIAQTIRDVLDV